MKYRALVKLFEGNHHYLPGDVLELTSERAKQLGGKVEYAGELPVLNAIEPVTTSIDEPVRDTNMKRKGRKVRV